MNTNGLAEIKHQLRRAIDNENVSHAILGYLFPDGYPHTNETELWDYKEEFLTLFTSPTKEDKILLNAKYADIVKDAVSFHNAYGGYIVFGVKDKGQNRIVGCEDLVDCTILNQKIYAATGVSIQCSFEIHDFQEKMIGLLLIPKRPSNSAAVAFKKDGPKFPNGKPTFKKGVYVRIRDECRPAASTQEDWMFLNSERNQYDSKFSPEPQRIKAKLPAKDSDLIKFVGRSNELLSLREWLCYPRSPTRLLTGIGGLGKTTIAYAFAEEVIRSGFNELERVIWVTAKQETFSALRGKMVETSGADFSDLSQLLEQLITELAGHTSVPDDADIDELTEALVSILEVYPSLIIVDDLDSLSPETQRECVAQLGQIAARTVDRDHASSRFLMTSRLDQGMPPTNVLKINGLDQTSFNLHIENLSNAFDLPKVQPRQMRQMHTTTHGSPLFASSLMRLVSLGENIKDVTERWFGSDGEDVRIFAFQRELERLEQRSAKALYAVILMRDCSLSDLERILDTTRVSIRDIVSELQNFHLIASGENQYGDTQISASKELISVGSILKKHIVDNGKSVELACARLRSETKGNAKNIGAQIRKIIDCWKDDDFPKALIIAKELLQKNPKNSDVACVLGVTYLKSKPPRYMDAEKALESARKSSCSRPELQSSLLEAKSGAENWQGLLEYTTGLSSKRTADDEVLDHFILATRKLTNLASIRGDFRREVELTMAGIERIESKISGQSLKKGYFEKLKKEQELFAYKYVNSLKSLYNRAGDRLDVFTGITHLIGCRIYHLEFIKEACYNLQTWWRDVESREIFDHAAYDLLQEKLMRLDEIKKQVPPVTLNYQSMVEILENTHRDLSYRAGKLQMESGNN